MAEKTKVGVIGVGQIGKRHVATYAEMPDVEIVALADVDEAEVKRVAAQHGVKQTFTNFRDLLALPEIQAVDVCLHNNFHAPVSIVAMEAGKEVYCEKPMAGTYIDALAMFEAAQRLGRRLAIQNVMLFSPEVKAARRLIDAGSIGRPYYGRAVGWRRRGRPYVDGYGTSNFVRKASASGGALIDSGVYNIMTLLYLLGNPEVKSISGSTYQELDMDAERRANSGYDVEELGLGFVRLAGGITLDIEISWAIHYEGTESSKVLGTHGGIKLDPFAFFTTVADMELDGKFDLQRAEFRLHANNPNYEAFDSAQRQWIATLQGRVPGVDSASLALKTALISEGIYLSNELGREVTPDEVRERSVSTAVTNL
ncbi:MAG TPA: Gfo/Idh/MocA family oxidoreductase [Roseiflexaceae bacterium]|nr:Gfo/Idh/MocA family oxidoreductase [Roseiflexaceae bacterium]